MFCSLLGGKNNGISATGLGKAFNFTGVNHANMLIADPDLRERFITQKYSDHFGSIDPMFRAALLGAYCEEGRKWRDAVQGLIWKNYTQIRNFFAEFLPQVVISPLQGGFVIWLDWSAMPEGEPERLLKKAEFILGNGSDYGAENGFFTRMCIAMPCHVISDALNRLRLSITG